MAATVDGPSHCQATCVPAEVSKFLSHLTAEAYDDQLRGGRRLVNLKRNQCDYTPCS